MNKERLEELLELSECDLDSIEEFELLSGRSRLQARVLVELCPLEPDSSEILKQIVLETAIQESIHHHREKFTKRFSMVLNKLHEKGKVSLFSLHFTLCILVTDNHLSSANFESIDSSPLLPANQSSLLFSISLIRNRITEEALCGCPFLRRKYNVCDLRTE